MPDIETLINEQGAAFEAFKGTLTEMQTEVKKLGSADGLLTDRLGKIETALDKAVEGKAAIEAAIAEEKAERENLELKIGRMRLSGHSDESAVREIELKAFNDQLGSFAAARGRPFVALDDMGYDAYKKAQDRLLREGKGNLSPDEVKVLSVGSEPDGGYWVTPDLGGRIVSKVFESSPVRQNASVQSITTDALEGVEDIDEAGAGYAGEHATSGNETTPQTGRWRIEVQWIDTKPKATQQLLDDASVDVEAWLSNKVADKFARFENTEFVTGAANRIRGFVLGYTQTSDSGAGVTWGEIGYHPTGTAGDFDATNPADDLISLIGLLKNEYLGNAKFYTRRSIITSMRKFKDTTGQYLWQPSLVAGMPEMMMGYPVVRMEDMPALATNSFSLAFGDLARAYQIVDRQGIKVLRDPFTATPYIKFYTTKRTGGGVLNFEAIKLLKFGAS